MNWEAIGALRDRLAWTSKRQMPKTNAMKGINAYGTELEPKQIDKQIHRSFVGGLWEEVGQLQLEFLKTQGLRVDHLNRPEISGDSIS